jgi:hypothetical protein
VVEDKNPVDRFIRFRPQDEKKPGLLHFTRIKADPINAQTGLIGQMHLFNISVL